MSTSKNLDPGPLRTRTQRTSISCKCITITVGAILALVGYVVFVLLAWELYWNVREPHHWMYAGKGAEEVQDWSTIVRPLVDRNQKFDVVATVWARKDGENGETYGIFTRLPVDDPIFSGVVFRGVTFLDEHVHTKVDLTIPLKAFRDSRVLDNWHLRASFTLVPQAPSLLRYMKQFTTWLPPAYLSTFPPVSPGHDNPRDFFADSYGVTVPLIDFHPIKSSCGKSFEEHTEEHVADTAGRESIFVTTDGKSPLAYHPYVITRTDLRVVRMERLYNREAYTRHQYNLQLVTADFNGCPDYAGDGRKCHRTFRSRANCETEIELEIPDEKTGLNVTQFAYAPYLHVNRLSRGPLDLVPVPLNREGCPDNPIIEDHLNVTWNIAYSGSTAEKLELSDFVASYSEFNVTDTDFKKAEAQVVAQNTARFHGHKFSSQAHSGRNFIAILLRGVMIYVQFPLQIHYWYTRGTTVGISTIRSYLLSAVLVLYFPHDIWSSGTFEADKSPLLSLYNIFLAFVCGPLISFGVLKTTFHLELTRQRPFVRALPGTHLERASWRLETRGGMRWILAVLAGSFALYLIAPLRDFVIIAPLGPHPDPPLGWIQPRDVEVWVMYPLLFSGLIFQMVMNYRAKSFAGEYKLKAWTDFVEVLLRLTPHTLSWIAGSVGGAPDVLRDGFLLEDLLYMCVVGAFAVQASIYPSVRQDMEDEGSE